MEIATRKESKKCLIYEKIPLEVLLSQLPTSAIDTFLHNILKSLNPEQSKFLMDFLNIYFESNGSLDLIAHKQFIHKNTVQYRIKKVIDLTTYDPRILSDSVILFLACKLYKRLI